MAVQQNRFDAMSEDELVRHLQGVAQERRDNLAIGEQTSNLGVPEWIAEIWHEGGLAGRQVMFAAAGPSRREAMLALARKLAGQG
jgi:hypothetical protein